MTAPRMFTRAAGGLLALGLAFHKAEAIDWSAYSADNVEESAGSAVHLQAGIDPAAYGFGYTYGVRLIHAPYIGSDFGGFLAYDTDAEVFFGAPALTLWLIPQKYRLVPILGFGGSYQFCLGNDDAETPVVAQPDGTVKTYDPRATSHWAIHAIGGLRLRLNNGQYFDLGAFWQRPMLDLAPDEPENEIGIRFSLGFEL